MSVGRRDRQQAPDVRNCRKGLRPSAPAAAAASTRPRERRRGRPVSNRESVPVMRVGYTAEQGAALGHRHATPHPVRLAHGEGVTTALLEHRTALADLLGSRLPQMYQMQDVVAAEIEGYAKNPPRQKPASINLDAVMAQVSTTGTGSLRTSAICPHPAPALDFHRRRVAGVRSDTNIRSPL